MDPLKTNKQTPRKTEAHKAWAQPNFYFLIISEPHSHVLSPAFRTTDDPSWQQSLKTLWAHTQITLNPSISPIHSSKKEEAKPLFPPNHHPQMCRSSSPIPCCTLLGYNKNGRVKNIFFSFKSNADFPFSNLFSLPSHPANTTSRTLPWNVYWGGAKGLHPVPGRVEFLPCSGPRGFFRNLFRALGKTQNTKLPGKELNLSTSHPLVTQGQVQTTGLGKHSDFLGIRDERHVPESALINRTGWEKK